MKRLLFVVVFCTSLLAGLTLFLFPITRAAENPLVKLLNLPAPPPPNPDVTLPSNEVSEKFFSKSNPPPDNAPIEQLMDYWRVQSENYAELGYNPKPSERVLDRLLAEVEKDPAKAHHFLNAFRESTKAADLVKRIYDRMPASNEAERNARARLKRWLTNNSPYFSSELARTAARAGDFNEYVNYQQEFLALGRVDWERARPLVDRLYGGNGKVSRVLAQWALYRHALDEDSLGDIERYRDELKAVVEDKTATAGMRDLAFDALVKEKEWSGRDEWYYSLLADETLDDLRVNGSTYTGLTTIMYYSPDEKYIDKMAELVKSDNKTVRTAAAKNLLRRLNTKNPEVVRALLPWLEDPKWINIDAGGRTQVVSSLESVKLPESVPALIAALDEKERSVSNAFANSNMAMANAANAISRAANMVANAANMATYRGAPEISYPLRFSAIRALAFQEDPRAVPALRRLLNEVGGSHEQNSLIEAVLKCGGFSIPEQVDALEYLAKNFESFSNPARNAVTNADIDIDIPNDSTLDKADIKKLIGIQLAGLSTVSDEVGRAVVDRITALDRSDPPTATAMRRIVLNWHVPAVNALQLRDLKNNRTDTDSIVRLLAFREELREKQMADVSDVRTGGPTAVGISACLLEDSSDYEAILNGQSDESKTALLACARLIRAPLPVQKVAESLRSKDKLLALAAERYLESEDSPEARRIVLSLHPNDAKILGATTVFRATPGMGLHSSPFLLKLFGTVSPYHAMPQTHYEGEFEFELMGETGKRLQNELKQDAELLGVYSWEQNFIRIYKDRAVVSWEEDPARYRERVLTKEEFENFKGLLTHYKADELPPFLSCVREVCKTNELLMVGRSGGRRVFVKASLLPPLFAELTRTFEELRRPPSTIKYWAGKDVPGLEVLFADERFDVATVWKTGADFRLLAADRVRRVEIDSELESFGETSGESAERTYEEELGAELALLTERTKRAFDDFAWFSFSGGALGPVAGQPSDVQFIPVKDGFAVPSGQGQWKARAGAIEIRADEKGLYKIAAGKLTKIRTGHYGEPIVTPNGRWAVATKYDDEEGTRLVRVNLLTNREFVIDPGDTPAYRAIAFIASINRVLIGAYPNEYGHYEAGTKEEGEEDGSGYSLLDPETGMVIKASGEVRPLIQQTFRPLQPTGTPFEFWAAIPNENETVVGLYNTRNFNLKPVLKLPKIGFNSMGMWIDSVENKIYFAYEGHLLAAPIKTGR